jgi:hypothetical protein
LETKMRDLGLDALVKASRTVNVAAQDAREYNLRRLRVRIAACLVAGAAASGASEAAAALAGGAAPATAAPASAALSGAFAKWAVVSILIAVGGGAGVGVDLYVARARASVTLPGPETAAHAGLPARAAAPQASAAQLFASAAPPTAEAVAAVAPASEPGGQKEPSVRAGSSTFEARSFERELQLLRSARRALDSGSPALALTQLDQYAIEFPHGALKPEFQTTRILALCAAGRVSSAQQARDKFIKEQPGSPLAEGLRATCAGGR